MRWPTPIAFHGQQEGQFTQDIEGMYAVENSQAQIYNLAQSTVWSSGSTTNAEPPKFSHEEDRLLRNAVASNTPFPYIKAFMFPDRTDISTEALESRSREKGALWGKWEDDLVRQFLVEGKEPDHEFITTLQKWLPWRALDTLRVRISYLKKKQSDGEVPQSEQPHGCNTQGDHLGPLGDTVDVLNHSNTDPYAFLTGGFNQNFEHTSAVSAQTYPNYRMKLQGFGIEGSSTDGSARLQQHCTQNVQDNTSGHLGHDLDSSEIVPYVSLSEGPDGGFVDHNTISAANYYSNNPIDMGEYQGMDMSNEALPQVQQYSNRSMPPSVAGYPTAAPNYPSAGLPPFQLTAATQSLAGFNTSSAPSYDSVQWAPEPITPNEPGYPEQGSSNLSHEGGVEDIRTAEQLEKYVTEIKKKVAQNWSWQDVNAAYCPHYNYFSMRDLLERRGCKFWKRDQDRQLTTLRRNGNDWAQICAQLTGPPRTQEEVEVRFQWLTGESSAADRRQT